VVGPLPDDPLVPDQPSDRWVRQEVEVVGLRDDHLVAASPPVQLRAERVGPVFILNGGIARLVDGTLQPRQRYVVWSAVPTPSPRDLAGLGPTYPGGVLPDLDVDSRVRMLPFGDPGHAAQLEAVLSDERTQNLWAFRPFVRAAQRVTRGARTPYQAVVALESWFRSSGGFRYEEHPPRAEGVPALVDFVTRTKAGYCQHYAGAMALMLRYLGIPARVAVGFTSGRWERNAWTVTDHDAHAWVEVWFPGQGWISFDPTPGRGTLAGDYTFASDSAATAREAIGEAIQGVGGGLDPTAGGPLFGAGAEAAGGDRPSGWGLVPILLAALLLGGLGIGLAKRVRRRLRYATSDPRRRAAAARRELADFLRDQGLDVPESATLEDLRRLLSAELGVNGGPFAAAAGAGRFGPPDGAEAAARRAREELRPLLRAVRTRLSTAERLRGWLALRSLRGA
jgi:transglutaminase-like putative cysteine protease